MSKKLAKDPFTWAVFTLGFSPVWLLTEPPSELTPTFGLWLPQAGRASLSLTPVFPVYVVSFNLRGVKDTRKGSEQKEGEGTLQLE